MSHETWNFRVQHILESVEKIRRYTQGMSFDEFTEEIMTIDAVLRNLEIMGEAARHVPQDFQDQHSEVPWHEMIAMRNVLAHGYFKLDLDIVWNTIQNDVLPLIPMLKSVTESLQDKQ